MYKRQVSNLVSDVVVGQPIAVRSAAEQTTAYEDTQIDKDPSVNESELLVFHELQPLFTDDVSELEPFVPFDMPCSTVSETLVANEQINDSEDLRNASSYEENRADYCTGRDQLQENSQDIR